MKLRTLCAAAMVAAIGAGLALPVGANAAATPHSVDSTGDVVVAAGSLDPTNPIVDPEKPGQEVIDPEDTIKGDQPGSLGITNVSALNFGTIETSQYAINQPAYAQNVHLLDADGVAIQPTVERGALVVFGDIRGEGGLGYTVQAELTQQFTISTGTDTLTNASVSFNNGIMETDPDNTTVAAEAGTLTPSFTLSMAETDDSGALISGGAVDVVNAAVGTGSGVYTLEFGQSAAYDANDANIATGGEIGTAGTAVVLNVPADTAKSMTLGSYQALVTWTIGALA